MPTQKKPTKAQSSKKAAEKKTTPKKASTAKQATAPKKDIAAPNTARKSRIPKPRAAVGGFADFLREQSVVGLAIGLVIGAQVKALADQMIASFINPFLGLVMPGTGSLESKTFVLHLGHKSALFGWGKFSAALLSFLVTAAVIYIVFKSLKLDTLTKKK